MIVAPQDDFTMTKEIKDLMNHHSSLELVKGILARVIQANSKSDREVIRAEPDVDYLDMAWRWMLIIASTETVVDVVNGKLTGLAPLRHGGIWVTRGRLGKGMFRILGIRELPILLPQSRLAYLVMRSAHEEKHNGPKNTLWRSRTKAWIVKGFNLAKKVERECMQCTIDKKQLARQKMEYYLRRG